MYDSQTKYGMAIRARNDLIKAVGNLEDYDDWKSLLPDLIAAISRLEVDIVAANRRGEISMRIHG